MPLPEAEGGPRLSLLIEVPIPIGLDQGVPGEAAAGSVTSGVERQVRQATNSTRPGSTASPSGCLVDGEESCGDQREVRRGEQPVADDRVRRQDEGPEPGAPGGCRAGQGDDAGQDGQDGRDRGHGQGNRPCRSRTQCDGVGHGGGHRQECRPGDAQGREEQACAGLCERSDGRLTVFARLVEVGEDSGDGGACQE